METKSIKTALISVFDKDGIDKIVKELDKNNVKIISTGGTKSYIENLGIKVTSVEELTGYPSILGGRVKTLHPKIFGGILGKRDNNDHISQMQQMEIPEIDLVIVDLYPFEKTVEATDNEAEIIEKIDIGGISLIRAAAKNFKDVVIIPSKKYYSDLLNILENNNCQTTVDERKSFAKAAFSVSSNYDTAIYNYFKTDDLETFRYSNDNGMELRYGENPHQKGKFFGDFNKIFNQLHGKQISYNNLLDITSAVDLISEFDELTVAILKHTNACGLASRTILTEAWKDALAGDPLSAFGGIIITNTKIDSETAIEIDKIFYEVIIAPDYDKEALEILSKKKNRIILVQKTKVEPRLQLRNVLNGVLVQEKDTKIVSAEDFKYVTDKKPSQSEIEDLIFANKLAKNSKSNTIVLAKNKQLIASGVGETSRVDALKHAIEKAKNFEFELKGAVMSSDAFFPFADSVEIAHKQGITSVIQPGGSIKDQDSIDFCNKNNMSMVFTGFRHFKH
ncbi:MAG: bifunctional phosphoribosylaminoimidazolecarboxamide formyltransferase/IMP cyclohydrolase [Bacteroidales bacterium]|nr:bifunctional phosphoribosylaminoimidazolecarboxamide formyltransferase/IMP cyclohydrolase [Bacteroidales bacterium]